MEKNGSPMLEQSLYFLNLATLFLTISSYYIMYYEQNKSKMQEIRNRIAEKEDDIKEIKKGLKIKDETVDQEEIHKLIKAKEREIRLIRQERIAVTTGKITEDGPDPLVTYLSRKIKMEKTNSIWKVSFYLLKYIHVLMIAILYYLGS